MIKPTEAQEAGMTKLRNLGVEPIWWVCTHNADHKVLYLSAYFPNNNDTDKLLGPFDIVAKAMFDLYGDCTKCTILGGL